MEIAVVVDTNVIFAALIRSGGLNRYILTLYPELLPFFHPEAVKEEILNHIDEIATKAKMIPEEIKIAMEVIFEPMTLVSTSQLYPYKQEAEKYVQDAADAPFVACALMLKEEYTNVVILTGNTKDYNVESLKNFGIQVITPSEFLRWVKEGKESHAPATGTM
ncbi:PIN domain-containing protein [Thermococcus sp.]